MTPPNPKYNIKEKYQQVGHLILFIRLQLTQSFIICCLSHVDRFMNYTKP